MYKHKDEFHDKKESVTVSSKFIPFDICTEKKSPWKIFMGEHQLILQNLMFI
jgi:hypothetical protein